MTKGKIIVIDGPDGVGKATTTKKVLDLFATRKPLGDVLYTSQSFPNYDKFYGRQVRNYLNGDDAHELVRMPEHIRVDPVCASLAYAADRYVTYKHEILPKLEEGACYILDRYYTSNMAHQGGRFETPEERNTYFKRLLLLETKYFGIPFPDAVIILTLPEEIRQARTENRRQAVISTGASQTGQVSKTDLHEQSTDHMRRAAEQYRKLAKKFKWPLVDGYENGQELNPDQMAEKAYTAILQVLA